MTVKNKYILAFSIFLSLSFFVYFKITIPSGSLITFKLTQVYALSAVAFLYVALLAVHYKNLFAVRFSLALSALYFGTLHAYLAFFKQLGGFEGLGFLSWKYVMGVILGASILTVLVIAVSKWKTLQIFAHFAGILALVHMFTLGTHFANLSSLIPKIVFVAVSFLFLLEAKRIDVYLEKKFKYTLKAGAAFLVAISAISVLSYWYIKNGSSNVSLGIHAQHIKQAQEALSGGQSGDRYSVSFEAPEAIIPGRNFEVRFKVYNASTGREVEGFDVINDKLLHLVIVDESLEYFDHIHPENKGSEFFITTSLPKEGTYHLYLNFHPTGGKEQQFAFSKNVGPKAAAVKDFDDRNYTKVFGEYEVSLDVPERILANDLNLGKETFTFEIKSADTKEPVTNLEPYLAAFGHMVMIHTQTYEYVHVHPVGPTPFPGDMGGPSVQFSPLALFGAIRPGVYKVFTQFNPAGNLITTDFIIEVQ